MWSWLILIAFASAIATAFARAYAQRRELVDEPGERRSHQVATPRGGGIGPVLAGCGAMAGLALGGPSHAPVLWAATAAVMLVAAVGWWDDHRPLPAITRLLVHAVAGAVLASVTSDTALGWVLIAFATVALANVWNFMDGINGLAASQALIVAAAAAMLLSADWRWVASAWAVAAAAFLPFNFPRARIFMGDVGSGALGVAIAALMSRSIGDEGNGAILLLAPLAAFLVDSGMTLGRRVLRRERWWTAHTQHLYQAWARRAGHSRVTLIYGSWTLAGAALAVMLGGAGLPLTISCVGLWYIATVLLWLRLQGTFAHMDGAPYLEGDA
jgi:UDP-N-acetylmuramyl pentapeptide phosphotransferase/UDP-N-acetylglucosamine-1-phosphate transferase